MKKTIIFWSLSIIITLASVTYQRLTGPTYSVHGVANVGGNQIAYSFERSHSITEDYIIKITSPDAAVKGVVVWKLFPSNDSLTRLPMAYKNGVLYGIIPKQPPAGKVAYQVLLSAAGEQVALTSEPVIIRFKGDVPLFILLPHIFCMFFMLLLSTRTGFEFFQTKPRYKLYSWLTFAFIIAGGMILGPVTQKYAFGAYWTGIPFGHDLTDNKTLIALVAWICALIAAYRSKQPGKWALAAAIVTFLVFLIPHSVLGSEIDHTKLSVK